MIHASMTPIICGTQAWADTPWGARVVCSPRTRGWSPSSPSETCTATVLPAHAGMVPPGAGTRPFARRAPRARGDGPEQENTPTATCRCSPRTRGWSHGVDHAHLSRSVLPAHAGMVPTIATGVTATSCAPRARGDGPQPACPRGTLARCSPRTRGWSFPAPSGNSSRPVLPAHAGMVPKQPKRRESTTRAPRARGDGPANPLSGTGGFWVLPAHAGMVPVRGSCPRRISRAPRARGDGPLLETI